MKKLDKKLFSADDIKMIFNLRQEGRSYKQIAESTGRTVAAITRFFQCERMTKKYSARLSEANGGGKVELKVNGVKVGEAPVEMVETSVESKVVRAEKEMSPREMIKRLYDMGYRIENNQLVCYVRREVKLQDIING